MGIHPVCGEVGGWRASCISCPSSRLHSPRRKLRGNRQGGQSPLRSYQDVIWGELLPELVWTQGMEYAFALERVVLPLYHRKFLTINSGAFWLSVFGFRTWRISSLKTKKLMWAQEEKVQILATIWASLPVIVDEAALIHAVEVPEQDAMIIIGATSSSQRNWIQGATIQGPWIVGALALPIHWITHNFLQPLALPAYCLLASDWDPALNNQMESSSSNGSVWSFVESAPHPQIFRMWVETPHWGLCIGTWSWWLSCSLLTYLSLR